MRERERERKDLERSEDAQRPALTGPAVEVLALQRAAGNQAVGAMLARQPKPTAPKDKPKAPAAVTGNRVVFPGVGTIAIESIQMGGNRQITSPSGTGSDREGGAPSSSEIVISSLQGDHSAALFRASLDGKGANVEIILEHGKEAVVIELANAIVSSYSLSGADDKQLETWTLNAAGIKFRRRGEQPAQDHAGSVSEWSLE